MVVLEAEISKVLVKSDKWEVETSEVLVERGWKVGILNTSCDE